MEKFACKNLGLDCDFEVTGVTNEEVMILAMDHGSTVHADLMKDMTPEQSAEFGQKLEASIQTV